MTDTHIGFTGTRLGMTHYQAMMVQSLLEPFTWLHHGDCVGADVQAHDLAHAAGLQIAIHPPTQTVLRAYCKGQIVHPPKGYIARNHDIVDAADRLIAAPAGLTEQGGGTWNTARYARFKGKPVTLVLPNGDCLDWGAPPSTKEQTPCQPLPLPVTP